jgi:hypothetical protein
MRESLNHGHSNVLMNTNKTQKKQGDNEDANPINDREVKGS